MSIRQRLYPAPAQLVVLTRHCGDARYVWNLALEQANWFDRHGCRGTRPTPNSTERMRQLTEARAASAWLADGSAVVQQQALRDFDRAMFNWWAGLRKRVCGVSGRTHARPRWRKAGLDEGFGVVALQTRKVNRRWGELLIPKAGWVRFRLTRVFAAIGACRSGRVTLDRCGRWHVAFVCAPPPVPRTATGQRVGVDRGVSNSAALSDGRMLHAPGLTAGEQRRFVWLQRRLARQREGSNRRAATRQKLAGVHARLGDRRRNWMEQTSTVLVREFDLIAVEALNTRAMTARPAPKPDPDQAGMFLPNGARAKATLNRAILASCWGGLETRLTQKAVLSTVAPCTVVRVDPRNTSRTCAACGHTAAESRESQAVFVCRACGHQAHADTNAAVNILARALTQTARVDGVSTTGEANPRGAGAAARRSVYGRISLPPVTVAAASTSLAPAGRSAL